MARWHSLPAELYELVERTPASVLLECAKPIGAESSADPRAELLTRLFIAPLRVITANDSGEIPTLFAEIEGAVAAGHSAAGFFTYECGSSFEPTAAMRPSRAGQPLAWIGIYERAYLFDHRTGTFQNGDPPGLARFTPGKKDEAHPAQLEAAFALTEEQYADRIATIHEWIRGGDIYQLNLTAPYRVHTLERPVALYARLRSRQPVAYGAFLHWQPNRHILSFSPELFFHVEQEQTEDEAVTRRITTRPMKGTAPRGRTTREDQEIAEWLRDDPKNRSENVMIVDLLRNDLGRVCEFGSVRAQNLFAVERYPTLWQMTSTITGNLRPEIGFHQIFRALFPCGSITGAPKVRAMQLLAKIEGEARGVYTGAIGFFSRERTVFNVAIRTLELDGEQGRMGVGSGIVIDSDASEEFRECALKAEFLTSPQSRSPENFSLIESLLWQNGYPLIELHLDRLQDSAAYFGFPYDRIAVKAALQAHADAFPEMMESQKSPKKLGAPGPSLLRTWESTNLNQPNFLTPPQKPGAPGPSRLGTWETTNLSPSDFPALPNPKRLGKQESPSDENRRKVRLLLDSDGALHISDEILPDTRTTANPIRVRIAQERTDPADPTLFHKTTHRPLYADAFKAATEAGFDDVLFLNNRGEVTESAIHNIFVEKDGRWFTPPVECGLLAGVQRRHLLETRPEIEERVLSLDDLRHADAIYLANAVRGLRRAIVDFKD